MFTQKLKFNGKKIKYYVPNLPPPSGNITVTVGTGGAYSTLDEAFKAIWEGDLQGIIVLQIISSMDISVPAILYETGYNGVANYSQVYVYPTTTAIIISGSIDGDLITFDAAQNITINGKLNWYGPNSLTIENTYGGSANTLRYINGTNAQVINSTIIGNIAYI